MKYPKYKALNGEINRERQRQSMYFSKMSRRLGNRSNQCVMLNCSLPAFKSMQRLG